MADHFKAKAGLPDVSAEVAQKVASAPRPITDRRSLCDHGPYSAYCQVCWNGVYALYIDAQPHYGVCPFGAFKPEECENARNWAAGDAMLLKALHKQGGL